MKILRLEYIDDAERGPWYMRDEDNFGYLIFGQSPDYGAYAADKVAISQGVMKPSAHPGPTRDPVIAQLDGSDISGGSYFFGFANPDQYAEWFRTPEVRRAALGDKINLVCYEVPDDKVTIGETQVVFKMSDVISKEALDRSYAIHLTP